MNTTKTMTETDLWNWMRDGKAAHEHRNAFATLAHDADLPASEHRPKGVHIPKGTRVRVVMASRLGDVGITTDLNARNGYVYRTTCVSDTLTAPGFPDIKLEPKGLLIDIEPIVNPA